MSENAFVIIDVQNDFCPGGALAVPEGDRIVPIINNLQQHFDIKIITQDWHPANHSSFAANQNGAAPFSTMRMDYGTQVLWPTHCVQGSAGAAFHPDLETDGAALILRKGFRPEIDSYSAFFENDRKTPTGLGGYLKQCGIGAVTLAGLATDFCVRYTALDAVGLGLSVTLVEDACRAIDLDGSRADAMREMSERGVSVVTSAALLS